MTESTKKVDPFAQAPAAKPEVPEVEALVVSANPGKIAWPTDKWGYTSKLRKEFLIAASTVNAQPDKQKLMLEHLDIMHAHLVARFDKDAATKKASAEQSRAFAEDRLARGHR